MFIADIFNDLLLDFYAEKKPNGYFLLTYHGDEQVVALWFSPIAKIPEIKVCFIVCFIYISISFSRGSNKDPTCSFSETYFEDVMLLQCRFLRRKPSFVRKFCCVESEGVWHQADPAARCRYLHGVLFMKRFVCYV